MKLALLTACKSAVSAADDAFSSVAGRLIRGGVDAVIAMSASLLVASATSYTRTFYRALAKNTPVPLAHEQARQQLNADPRRHVLQRTPDEPGEPVMLRDWWLPHFYQQRPLDFAPAAAAQPVALPVTQRKLTGFPHPPRYGFGNARARDLQTLERALLNGKLLVIQGFGGQGKTSLATEAADWLTRTGMYRGALFLSMEGSSGGASWLLAELARHLEAYDGSFNPDDHPAALARLRPRLRTHPTLLVVDSLESILPRGDAPLADAERARLWDALLTLRQFGAGIVITTRDVEFGDARLLPGVHTQHLRLAGLSPSDAYALASRLLEVHTIGRERAPYPELMQLLAQLDYHPLAIEQVLPMLKDEAIDRVLHDFSALLERCLDETTEGRNRSLLASLDYSLRRLTDAQREWLPRLALFEGGGLDLQICEISEIDEQDWNDLRRGLENAALISADADVPFFLRFHPVLAPALRRHPAADDPARRERYATRYHALATYLMLEDTRNPLPVRALVRRELPNLRRAFDLLRAQGAYAAAVDMAECIARFLFVFSLGRELADLRRKQEQAAALIPADGTLSQAEFLQASGQGEDAYNRGDLQTAYDCFRALLAQIEAGPAGTPRGPGSYEHCLTLGRLARCLRFGGQPAAAEPVLHQALGVIDELIAAQPDPGGAVGAKNLSPQLICQRGGLLTDLGDLLTGQGRYAEARAAYEESLQVKQTIGGDQRGEGVVLGQLGTLALKQRDYAEAARRYREALDLFCTMNEPAGEAVIWHQLGIVAQEQRQWAEAERCYREALALHERRGDTAKAAHTCNNLAIVAVGAGRPSEAEGWYKRAIELSAYVGDQVEQARNLNNLASLLMSEIRAGRMRRERLAEARGYAERALVIRETLDASSEIWKTLSILAELADLAGSPDQARVYRRRERETFAQFAGNRWHIDNDFGDLIRDIAAVARGDATTQAEIEAEFPKMEAGDWGDVPPVIRRIWAGERDWHALCEGLDRQDALLILRVLETGGWTVHE